MKMKTAGAANSDNASIHRAVKESIRTHMKPINNGKIDANKMKAKIKKK